MLKVRHAAAFFIALLLPAACQTTSPPSTGARLTLPTRPPLSLQIDAAFTPLPTMHFPIEALTDVDRHVFVEADAARTIRRMVIVQYEVVQNKSQFRFRYPPKPPALFGVLTYRYGAYVYDDARAAAGAPLKEAALTRAMLSAQGYHLPRLLRVARLARVADSEGQSEMIIFYMENADDDYPAGPLQGADEDGDLALAPADKDAIFGRLENALHPLSGCCH